MDYRHPINEASLSYQWSINMIIILMEHHHPVDGVASSSYHYRHHINEELLSYQWSINIIILSMEHHHHPILEQHYPTNGSTSSYQ
ncbi:hypothetical protein KY284_022354 [Solanum tuberosum]|nr:hypothetical protein KY284_022354 [Solanum tuberosum]